MFASELLCFRNICSNNVIFVSLQRRKKRFTFIIFILSFIDCITILWEYFHIQSKMKGHTDFQNVIISSQIETFFPLSQWWGIKTCKMFCKHNFKQTEILRIYGVELVPHAQNNTTTKSRCDRKSFKFKCNMCERDRKIQQNSVGRRKAENWFSDASFSLSLFHYVCPHEWNVKKGL